MEEKLVKQAEKSIEKILNDGLTTNNLDILYKLTDIYKDAKEVESMNYGNYGEYGARGRRGYGEYNEGSYGEYGARRGRRRYRGDDEIERMAGEYGRYQESRSRYGAGDEETDKSYHYMVKALEDFIKVLYEEADTNQQKQELREVLQRSMM